MKIECKPNVMELQSKGLVRRWRVRTSRDNDLTSMQLLGLPEIPCLGKRLRPNSPHRVVERRVMPIADFVFEVAAFYGDALVESGTALEDEG